MSLKISIRLSNSRKPSEQILWHFFTETDTRSLVLLQGIMNLVKFLEILQSKMVPFVQTFVGSFKHDFVPYHNPKLF